MGNGAPRTSASSGNSSGSTSAASTADADWDDGITFSLAHGLSLNLPSVETTNGDLIEMALSGAGGDTQVARESLKTFFAPTQDEATALATPIEGAASVHITYDASTGSPGTYDMPPEDTPDYLSPDGQTIGHIGMDSASTATWVVNEDRTASMNAALRQFDIQMGILSAPMLLMAGAPDIMGLGALGVTARVGSELSIASKFSIVGRDAAESEAPSPFTQRYLTESGGRFGSSATRAQNYDLARGLENEGFSIEGGGGIRSEEYIPGLGPGTRGGTFVDITGKAADGRYVRIQTIDSLSDGLTATPREAAAAARIRGAFPNDELRLIPKGR